MQTKSSVRKIILSRLKRLRDLTRFEEQNRRLNLRLLNELKSRSGIWAAFMPLSNEPNLIDTYKSLSRQIRFAFPRVVGNDIQFFLGAHFASFQKGEFGIMEPVRDSVERVLASELTGIVVPGLAFDSSGARLGRGRGFYDRFLKKCSAEKIGVCFQTQFLNETLKTQRYDEKIDRLITENFTLKYLVVKNSLKNLAQSFDSSGFSERNFI